jgi:broad specificity phosphatase PhoE
MTHIILVRHGQTASNAQDRIRGQVDIPLDETGLSQARATAARVAADWHPTAVFSSPLRRAVQTAQAIATALHLEVEVVADLIDMNFGIWQGLLYTEVRRNWPELSTRWMTAPHTVSFPGGESLSEVQQRALPALQAIIERHSGQDVVVVGHTVLNRVLLCAVLGLDNSAHWRIGQDTCAVNAIEWRPDGYYVLSLNDTCHLRH